MATVSAPSNIAILKYWGKKDADKAIPLNASISMTLNACRTTTTCTLTPESQNDFFELNSQRCNLKDAKHQKIAAQLERIKLAMGYTGSFRIQTENSFPTGAGIASSASGFCALTLACISAITGCEDLNEIPNCIPDAAVGRNEEYSKISPWHRLTNLLVRGSGSSVRSLLPGWVKWEYDSEKKVHCANSLPSPLVLDDTIVICDQNHKSVGSSQGHRSVHSSPVNKLRHIDIDFRCKLFESLLAKGQWEQLGYLVELEAMQMHSVMMTSSPPLFYLNTGSHQVLSWLNSLRIRNNLAIYATIDAGPNIHILSEPDTTEFLRSKASSAFPNFSFIYDKLSSKGPIFMQ